MQVVGYESGVSDLVYDPSSGLAGEIEPPSLVLATDGAERRLALRVGRELAYRLGDRHCAGRLTADGHDPCSAPGAPYCPDHQSTWLCAQCRGDCQLPLEACREEHGVYLAAFAPATFKVGVTRLWRLYARLREQGADRAAHVHTVSNGRIARQIEGELGGPLVERVPIETKVAGIGRPVDAAAWTDLLAEYSVIDELEFDYGVSLEERPIRETIAAGTVVGTQGRLVVLEFSGATYAVDLRDLVGFEVQPGAPERDLQSSLGTFG